MGLYINFEINSEWVKLYKINIMFFKGDGEKLIKVFFKLFKNLWLIEMIVLGMRCKENEYYVYYWIFSVIII